jgi:flavorubredoxin/NADPH-dependent 2,4-dienoyl-CoA reductase/sulfur reductase-like enzyme
MDVLKLKDGLYWAGVQDPDLRVFDIIMYTEFGTTYNSYVLDCGDKTVLFETAKEKFFDDYLAKLKEVTDISKIDYIVVNHTEPDHAGSVEKLIDLNPNLKIVATPTAISFLKHIVNRDFYSIPVKDGDTLKVGNKTFQFLVVPNLHWPDTMYTYIQEDKTLVTCDSFGSHYSHKEVLRSKVTDEEGYMRATKYYFDCIIGPFKPYMLQALDRVEQLDIDMICPGHGPVLDSHLDEIKAIYRQWCTVVNPNPKKTVIIPYVSAYGYTKQLAEVIAQGIQDSGDIDVRSYDMVTADQAKVLEELAFADGILFGSPTIVGEALKPIWDLTTSIFAGTHGGKLASAFGSYGWSGEAVPHLMQRLKQLRMKTVEGLRIRFKPSQNDLTEAYDYGYNFGCVLQDKENPKKAKKGTRQLVKCMVCGEIFDSSLEICPVCGVGKENFIPVEEELVDYKKNTQEIYLVLGNGAAGLSAAEAIRQRNSTCSIVMVSNEDVLSYNRPMLTKSMIAGFDPSQIAIHDEKWYEENNITLVLGRQLTKLDTQNKTAHFADGITLKYDKCIYALGSECFIPPIPGHEKPEVIAIRRVSDTQKIQAMLPKVKNAVVIGGGVLGLEAAWELHKAKCNVTVLELADKLMGRQLDDGAGKALEDIIRSQGIDVHLNVKIDEITGEGSVTGVKLGDGTVLPAELVVVSCGVRANTSIAKDAGMEIGRAVIVNEKMETSAKDVYACGDCAEYQGINYAIWPQATEQGKVAGANAAGDDAAYETVPAALSFNGMNTSLFAIGDNGKNPDKHYRVVEFRDEAKKTYEKYYFANNRLCGVILIGDTSRLAEMTTAIEEHRQFKKMF